MFGAFHFSLFDQLESRVDDLVENLACAYETNSPSTGSGCQETMPTDSPTP